MNRRFANLCPAADGGFRPNVIPNPSCVRTRARSRAISRPDARSFRKTSREILFATLSTLASDASTYLDVRARRGEANARRRGRYNVTSIRNEHDAIFDAQRDRAQVRDAIARVRARAR